MRKRQQGFSLAEVLATVLLLSVVLGPAVVSLRSAMDSTNVEFESAATDYQLVERMETVLAQSFQDLAAAAAGATTPSSFSDTAGIEDRKLVFIAPYDIDNADNDGDPFTGTEDDVLWLRVELEDQGRYFESLKGAK